MQVSIYEKSKRVGAQLYLLFERLLAAAVGLWRVERRAHCRWHRDLDRGDVVAWPEELLMLLTVGVPGL